MQELVDKIREHLAFRHQRLAKMHASKRDYWRWQVEKPWSSLMPSWTPWVLLAGFWLLAWAVLR